MRILAPSAAPDEGHDAPALQGLPLFIKNGSRLNSFIMNDKQQTKPQPQKDDRGRTNVPGGNPRQNDAVDHDLYNDENRPNLAQNKQPKK
jgi:hypothetical protein